MKKMSLDSHKLRKKYKIKESIVKIV
jgi:hypothetical protein